MVSALERRKPGEQLAIAVLAPDNRILLEELKALRVARFLAVVDQRNRQSAMIVPVLCDLIIAAFGIYACGPAASAN